MATKVVFTSFFLKYFDDMKLSPEIIRERMFESFKKDVRAFYDERQERYFEQFEAKLLSGEIDVSDPNYKEIALREAEAFMATRPQELLEFIKKYVHFNFDIIADAVREGIMDKETAEVSMEVLKHILVAGELDADPEARLK
jgi:hypothetical protein